MSGEHGDWADRVAALRREKPAQWAMVATILALLAALLAWTFALLPSGRDIRGQPLFWLMALPAMIWMGAVQSYKAWAVRTILPVLIGAPILSLAALLAAPDFQDVLGTDQPLGTPLTMRLVLGATLLLASIGGVALGRSSLPGGGHPARFLPPGAVAEERTISAMARGALTVGSLALSGTLINGVFFSIETILPAESDSTEFSAPWPALIPAALAVVTAVVMVRGATRLRRGDDHAIRSLLLSWRIGAAGTGLMLPLSWIWPGPAIAKLAFSMFMVPVAIAAAWGASSARRRLQRAPEGTRASR